MTTVPTLPDGMYPFRDEIYPLRELAISEAPAELASFLIAHAKANGVELIRDEIVELVCKGDGLPDQRFTIYWLVSDRPPRPRTEEACRRPSLGCPAVKLCKAMLPALPGCAEPSSVMPTELRLPRHA